ncbi:hypothetical protein HOY80DRAFT_218084 [Tuber brumale]|nr:hypothetical protein HOY80DRAFT_218084 [Tuber brumale]
MRSSKSHFQAYDVFPYDFIDGTDGLMSHLSRLRKDSSENGDIRFIFSDGDEHRTYSPLFYIAAGNKLHTDFGEGDGRNVHVPEGKDLECVIEDILGKCCTKETLAGLWKAMNDVYPQAEGPRAAFQEPVLSAGLPEVLMPDFTIHLKEPGDKVPVHSAKVHRFLLPIRIAYFKTQFSSAFRDAHATEATFYTEEFTNFGLWAVISYVYDAELWSMFGSYELDKHMNSSPVSPGGSPDCTLYNTPSTKTPPVEIIDRLFEIVRAADFLQITDLKHWAHYSIVRMAHEFTCVGARCAHIVPYVLDQVYNCEVSDTWIFNKGLDLLSGRGIKGLWKRPLLKCNDAVITALVTKVREEMSASEQKMVEIYLRIHKHASLVATSNLREDWHQKIIDPLLDYGALIAADKLDSSKIIGPISTVLKATTIAKPGIHDLITRAASPKTINQKNCPRIFRGIRQLEKAIAPKKSEALREAKETVIIWLRKNWLSLSLIPAPDRREGNYFSAWGDKDQQLLAAELRIPVPELLAQETTNGGRKVRSSYAYDPAFGKFDRGVGR